ncbi:MAG TPA: 4Fe-4S dicluster domain-containing protein [Bryobacteraceae bacterium]|nr:4Fe-4S dicluster domain-containing protein [Bryobacteraceae bacterium]
MARYAMVIDLQKCVGCQACTVACNSEWDVPAGYARTHVRQAGPVGKLPSLLASPYIAQCNHCDHPTCVAACPTGATFQTASGIVKVNRDLCIGCGFCVDACPYDARFLNPAIHKVDKCDFCADRLEKGLPPACVTTCTAHAKYFGDLEDAHGDVFRLVYERGGRRNETADVHIGPNVYYLGRKANLDLALATFAPRLPRLVTPGRLWRGLVKPLVLAAIGATFLGQAVAFFYQLRSGEKQFDD